jgi:UDP-glucose 4-epimerase
MTENSVVLVTGVGKYWGAQLARRLLAESYPPVAEAISTGTYRVIGIDAEPLKTEIRGLDFIQADVRNPLLLDLLKSENVETVCHLDFDEGYAASEASFDLNVMGTMKLLGMCAEAGVRKFILGSSTAVYGARPTNPAFLTENHPLQADKKSGAIGHLVEIEAFCNGFRRQVPEMVLTTFRLAGIVGPTVNSRFTRFLKQPVVSTLMGFNPLMQVIHENDVVDVFVHAINHDAPGIFNVAAEGNPPLAKLLALAGRTSVPFIHWFAYWGKPLTRSYWPIEMDYLRYSWVADLTKMREELRFVPQYTAEEALREFAAQQRLGKYKPQEPVSARDEELLRDTLERRRRVKEQQVSPVHDMP